MLSNLKGSVLMKSTLEQTHLSVLANLPIGKRVRYIREHLRKEFGNEFSGKSVANRIQLFSQSTLTTIERGKTKDIPSKVLYAISKDFGANLYMFFDDYYQNSAINSVDLYPPLYHIDTHTRSSVAEVEHSKYPKEGNNTNPLHEDEYAIKTTVSKVSINEDEQITFTYKSRVKYSEQHLFHLLSQVINQINTLDISIDPSLAEDKSHFNSIKLAKDFVKHGKESLHTFPWYFHRDKLEMDNQSFEKAVKYTEQLIKESNHNKNGEEVNHDE